MTGLYPVPDNLLEIKNFRTDSFRVPTSLVGGRIEKTHVKQCENSNGKHLGPALPPPEPEKGPPQPPASPRSPHTDGLTDLSPGTSPTLIFLHVVLQKAAEDGRAAAQREGGFGNVFGSTGG